MPNPLSRLGSTDKVPRGATYASPGRNVRGRRVRGARGWGSAKGAPSVTPTGSKLSGAPALHVHTFLHLTLSHVQGRGWEPLYPRSQLRNSGPEGCASGTAGLCTWGPALSH